ncbi:recombination mediator RecR [Patescibacteria group bacterium]|nr:recombination mediator RecR [Patescibacteria group bacterium]
MSTLPSTVEDLINEFAKLPGIGYKSAQRVVFYLTKASKDDIKTFSAALAKMADGINFCSTCQNLTEDSPCSLCVDSRRDKSQLCVVEKPLDVVALEDTHNFDGLYHVLHGAISPINGVGPEDIKIKELLKRVKDNGVEEIILATNPNLEGEATAMYISKLIKPLDIKITRIARGLPTGSDLEYADQETLSNALAGRKEF